MPKATTRALLDGLADATGFFGGALLGWGAGVLLGCNVLAPGAWTTRTLIGWALLLAGCGLGKWAAMQAKARWLPSTR